MFKTELYAAVAVAILMPAEARLINDNKDTIKGIMEKFKTTGAWNLLVIIEGIYFGYILPHPELEKSNSDLPKGKVITETLRQSQ